MFYWFVFCFKQPLSQVYLKSYPYMKMLISKIVALKVM